MESLIFDLDETLINMGFSKEKTISEMVTNYIGQDYSLEKAKHIRETTSEKNYFDAIRKLLIGYGIEIDKQFIIEEFNKIYFDIVKSTEKMYIKTKNINFLKNRYNLFIATGRPRIFFDKVWGNRLDKYFNGIICQDDVIGLEKKPSPDIILQTINKFNIKNPRFYIGNSPNDCLSSCSAGLDFIGVQTTHSRKELFNAGAKFVIKSVNDLPKLLMVI